MVVAAGGVDPATIVTGGVLAFAAVTSAVTPVVLARRRATQDALKAAQADSGQRGDLTLASWTALNDALQREITRLTGVGDRQQGVIDGLQARIGKLEAEIDALQATIKGLTGSGPHA